MFISRLFRWIKTKFLYIFSRKAYYINGAETLPPPLDEAIEEKYILTIENPASRDALIEHNLRLVVYIAKRFENTGVGIEELISTGTVGLIKAISTFNSNKNIKLATYASRCIENEILMFIRKNTTKKKEVSFDEPLSVDWDGNELLLSDVLSSEIDSISASLEDDEEKQILSEAIRTLNEREQVIVRMRFGLCGEEELTQKEVADALGISQSYISRLEKKIMRDLRRKIEEKI